MYLLFWIWISKLYEWNFFPYQSPKSTYIITHYFVKENALFYCSMIGWLLVVVVPHSIVKNFAIVWWLATARVMFALFPNIPRYLIDNGRNKTWTFVTKSYEYVWPGQGPCWGRGLGRNPQISILHHFSMENSIYFLKYIVVL